MENKGEKLKILFRAWFSIPHSYSLVNCFQIVHLYKKYKDVIDFYIEEMPYFREEWNNSKKLVYSEEYNDIIRNLKQWNGEEVDLVYSITYPYDITTVTINDKVIPKCVFYTSEFATLEPHYFNPDLNLKTDQDIKDYVMSNDKLYMTSPSIWSSLGMIKYGLEDSKNRVITHGVDTKVFKYDVSRRKRLREFYKVKDSDILMINIGSMTKNKGMLYILQVLNVLVNRIGRKNYKLLLKGTGDLYQSKVFLELYFEELRQANAISVDEMNILLKDHIIFTDKTLSCVKMNDLYNAADLYLSPYLAEGFNLAPLEALSSGLPVMISKTGSTHEYTRDIYKNGGNEHVIYIESDVLTFENGYKQNNIDFGKLLNLILENEDKICDLKDKRGNGGVNSYNTMKEYIEKDYSWDHVAELLFDYFKWIVKN
jgi:glycosyltransferase involved in cell wall biosynthesis